MEYKLSGRGKNPSCAPGNMRRVVLGLLMWALLEFIFPEGLGQGDEGSKQSSKGFPASLHLIKEPGIEAPCEKEIYTAVKTDGYLQAAREKAMDDVRFEARNKGLDYQICGMTEEKMVFGYRVKIQYRLRPFVVEVVALETTWWQELLKKFQGYLPYLRKVLAEAERFVNSTLPERQKTGEAAIP